MGPVGIASGTAPVPPCKRDFVGLISVACIGFAFTSLLESFLLWPPEPWSFFALSTFVGCALAGASVRPLRWRSFRLVSLLVVLATVVAAVAGVGPWGFLWLALPLSVPVAIVPGVIAVVSAPSGRAHNKLLAWSPVVAALSLLLSWAVPAAFTDAAYALEFPVTIFASGWFALFALWTRALLWEHVAAQTDSEVLL